MKQLIMQNYFKIVVSFYEIGMMRVIIEPFIDEDDLVGFKAWVEYIISLNHTKLITKENYIKALTSIKEVLLEIEKFRWIIVIEPYLRG